VLDSVFVLKSVVPSLDAFPFWDGVRIRPHTPLCFSKSAQMVDFCSSCRITTVENEKECVSDCPAGVYAIACFASYSTFLALRSTGGWKVCGKKKNAGYRPAFSHSFN
jgi:hypothetical protein